MSSLSPDLRCERCFHTLPSNEDHCPNCGLVVPKSTPGGKALGMAGRYATPKTPDQLRALADRELRGQAFRESLTDIPKKGFQRNPVVIAVLAIAGVVLGGLLGWGIREYQLSTAPAGNDTLAAVRLVVRASAKTGGTVEAAAGEMVSKLAAQGKIQDYPGWSATPENGRWRVRFAYQEKGQPLRTAEWTVDLAQKSIRPENDLARQLSN